MGGEDPGLSISAVMIARHAGERLVDELDRGQVTAAIRIVPGLLAGTSDDLVRLFAPPRLQLGSSVSHWDTTARPSLLMNPSINPDLESATDQDLTLHLLRTWAGSSRPELERPEPGGRRRG